MEHLRYALKSQYHAALAMLGKAIEQCPEELWTGDAYLNPFWRIAYHALFYTHLYIQPNEESFRPWERHQTGVQHMDNVPAEPPFDDLEEPPHSPPITVHPYSKED